MEVVTFYVVLFLPYILTILLIASVALTFRRKWKFSLTVITLCIFLNVWAEVFTIAKPFVISDASTDLVVMTYNMHAMGNYMDENRDSPDGILDFIMSQQSDVVALQEYDSVRCQVLQQRLSAEFPFHESMPRFKYMGENAVFSKFEIISCRYGVLNDSEKNLKLINTNNLRKINPERLIMLLELNVKGKKVRFANCHFESNNIDERIILDGDSLRWYQMLPIFNREITRAISVRKAEAELLNKWAKQNKDVPVIVCGDLNDFGGSTTLRTLQNHSKLKDAWWNGGFGYGATYHGHKFMYFRLDHILYNSELQLQKVKVAEQNFSDHDALVAGFRFQNHQ